MASAYHNAINHILIIFIPNERRVQIWNTLCGFKIFRKIRENVLYDFEIQRVGDYKGIIDKIPGVIRIPTWVQDSSVAEQAITIICSSFWRIYGPIVTY